MSGCRIRRNDWEIFTKELDCKKFNPIFKYLLIGHEGFAFGQYKWSAPPIDSTLTVQELALVVPKPSYHPIDVSNHTFLDTVTTREWKYNVLVCIGEDSVELYGLLSYTFLAYTDPIERNRLECGTN